MGALALAIVGLVWYGCARDQREPTGPGTQPPTLSLQGAQGQDLGPAIAAQERHTGRLLAVRGVVGTAVGLRADGRPAVKIYTAGPGVAGLPAAVDGVPVDVEVTGEILALGQAPQALEGKGKPGIGSSSINPASRFARPVPIGVSTGNEGECSAGTISARVKDASGNVYALSNNHVYALENSAPLGSHVLQPGLYDTNCSFDANNVIGTLAAFKPIVFSTSANNVIDAAIASTTTGNLGNSTPSNGYGTPSSTTSAAAVNMSVQKYGRTTSLTIGTVTGINATVNVGYSSGTARFVQQIVVQSRRAFIKPGDSGSLLVRNTTSANPVGLLFAGTSSGTYAVANPIGPVLDSLKVTVDGK